MYNWQVSFHRLALKCKRVQRRPELRVRVENGSEGEESQFTTSILCLETIMARLICSNETNITTFHDPNLRNDGTNLKK